MKPIAIQKQENADGRGRREVVSIWGRMILRHTLEQGCGFF